MIWVDMPYGPFFKGSHPYDLLKDYMNEGDVVEIGHVFVLLSKE